MRFIEEEISDIEAMDFSGSLLSMRIQEDSSKMASEFAFKNQKGCWYLR
jgi:hypothetical protein